MFSFHIGYTNFLVINSIASYNVFFSKIGMDSKHLVISVTYMLFMVSWIFKVKSVIKSMIH